MQSLIIGFLGVGDQLLDTDIFAHDITGAIQEQQCQKSAHAAVAIIERMDAEKVQNEHGNQQQRVEFCIPHCLLKSIAQCRYGFRRFPCWDRLKPNNPLTIRQFLGDYIIGVLEAAADGLAAELVQIPMKLQNDGGLRRDIVVTLVDCGQHIAVTGDLFLAAGLRHSLVADNFLEAIIRRNDALDTVGCLGTLNFCNLQQVSQCICLRLNKEVLLPLVLVDLRKIRHNLRRQELVVLCFEVEFSHSISSFALSFHHTISDDIIIVYTRMVSSSTLSLS